MSGAKALSDLVKPNRPSVYPWRRKEIRDVGQREGLSMELAGAWSG